MRRPLGAPSQFFGLSAYHYRARQSVPAPPSTAPTSLTQAPGTAPAPPHARHHLVPQVNHPHNNHAAAADRRRTDAGHRHQCGRQGRPRRMACEWLLGGAAAVTNGAGAWCEVTPPAADLEAAAGSRRRGPPRLFQRVPLQLVLAAGAARARKVTHGHRLTFHWSDCGTAGKTPLTAPRGGPAVHYGGCVCC